MRHSHNDQHDHRGAYAPEWSRNDGFGPRGFGPRGFGPGPFGRPGRGGPRGGRARGDVRAAILVLLADQPRHGYDIIRAIEERSDGLWSPSPGSVYPTLQALEDEGMLTIDSVEGRKTASLTDAGRAWVESHAESTAAVFDRPKGGDGAIALREEVGALAEAAMHVAHHHGGPESTERAVQIIATARKELYRLLADGE